MANNFMDKNFLLESKISRRLYKAVENDPVFDYHCHLSPAQIAGDIRLDNLADAWLSGDHYKWRVMRVMGIDESLITGNAAPYEKYTAWVETVENLIGNPLYHWTHLELQRYFNICEPLTKKSAPAVWEKANALLKSPELSVKGIFRKFNVNTAGTTDDPVDSLEHHIAIAQGTAPIGNINTKVIPSFRPDRALNIGAAGFRQYINELSEASGISIKNTEGLTAALEKRLEFFISAGCCSSDHGLSRVPFASAGGKQVESIFMKAMKGKILTENEADAYKTKMLMELAKLYARHSVVMQLHFAAIRNVNPVMLSKTGDNAGFDAANDRQLSENLASLLGAMEAECGKTGLPKTILYSLNPKDYYPLLTVMGGFQGSCPGKMQLGSAWWFCDHRDGMEEQLRIFAAAGVLPSFIGMLTDSRSFLSYPRHEYFRRVLCNLIGKWVGNGEYPDDTEKLEKIVHGISFNNALEYFR
jgi:glucuronate isomerase